MGHYNNTHPDEYIKYKQFTNMNKEQTRKDHISKGIKLSNIKVEERTGSVFVCKLCNKQFKTKNRLLKHEELKHGESQANLKNVDSQLFKCRFCQKVFGSEQLHRQHEDKLCELNLLLKMQHECGFCDQVFDTPTERDKHQKKC